VRIGQENTKKVRKHCRYNDLSYENSQTRQGKMKLGVIGCGNMGRAIVQGIIKNNILLPDSVFLNDAAAEKMDKLAGEIGAFSAGLDEILGNCDVILIAIKPQDSQDFMEKLRGKLDGQVLVSVMAGVNISGILGYVDRKVPVVRAMPNMAAFIGRSVTGISFSDSITDEHKEAIIGIFKSIGTVVEIEETQMDAVTALSGSGPAYLFYLAQAMIEAGVEMGISAEKAKQLVFGTIEGSGNFLMSSGSNPSELIDKVASKGGTTESALNVLNDKKVGVAIKEAILMAKDRSKEISGG